MNSLNVPEPKTGPVKAERLGLHSYRILFRYVEAVLKFKSGRQRTCSSPPTSVRWVCWVAQEAEVAQLSYRSDIDGLRAVAVLSVVAFHAFPTWLRGGFIGVDIFYVISGFLISGIIFNGLEQKNFRFVHFYARRIRRIFPALTLVLLFSSAIGWFALLPDEFKQLGRHIAASAGFANKIPSVEGERLF